MMNDELKAKLAARRAKTDVDDASAGPTPASGSGAGGASAAPAASAGVALPSPPTGMVTPAADPRTPPVPNAPILVSRRAAELTVCWTLPPDVSADGLLFKVEHGDASWLSIMSPWTEHPGPVFSSKCTITGLTPNTSYVVRVAAAYRHLRPTWGVFSASSIAFTTLTEEEDAAIAGSASRS